MTRKSGRQCAAELQQRSEEVVELDRLDFGEYEERVGQVQSEVCGKLSSLPAKNLVEVMTKLHAAVRLYKDGRVDLEPLLRSIRRDIARARQRILAPPQRSGQAGSRSALARPTEVVQKGASDHGQAPFILPASCRRGCPAEPLPRV